MSQFFLSRYIGRLLSAVLLLSLLAVAVPAQKKDQRNALRDVTGVVTDAAGKSLTGAVVQMKNTKTLQIISFITREQGDYYFHGLSPDIDFELSASFGDKASVTHTLSSFDSRKQAVVNLKLDHDRKP